MTDIVIGQEVTPFIVHESFTGWWFGTWFIVPDLGFLIIPTDELIFFRVAQPPTRFTTGIKPV